MLDLVLTLWVLGLVGEFVGIVLQQPLAVGASLALLLSPTAYVSLRSRLHRTARVRCDWLVSLGRNYRLR